jgi:hypothetical protein
MMTTVQKFVCKASPADRVFASVRKTRTGGCEKIVFPDFIRVLFLKGNVCLDPSNRLEGILTRSFFDCRSLASRKPIFSHPPDGSDPNATVSVRVTPGKTRKNQVTDRTYPITS